MQNIADLIYNNVVPFFKICFFALIFLIITRAFINFGMDEVKNIIKRFKKGK